MTKSKSFDWGKHLILGVLVFFELIPLLILLIMSVKSQGQFTTRPLVPTFPLYWENYLIAWSRIERYMFNSVTVTLSILLGNLILSSIAAYVFARYNFPLKN